MTSLSKLKPSNPKVWVAIGVGIAGVMILAEVQRRRVVAKNRVKREDFGAFVERFDIPAFAQPPPPASRLPLSGLNFAVSDNIDVKGYVTGFGSADWRKTHEAACKTAIVVTVMLKNGAGCVGRTVMAELGFGILGENKKYGTPVNPQMPSHVPGGSASGAAVAVAARIIDFAIGTDTIGCVRVPASFCGLLGFRPSHGLVSAVGVLPNSQSLDSIGLLAADPSVLHRVGHNLLQLNLLEPKRVRNIIIADDLFQLSSIPVHKTVEVVKKAVHKLSGYKIGERLNFGQHIASNVPSLKSFLEESTNIKSGISALKALSSAMFQLRRYEFITNHEDWIKSVKPKLGPDVSSSVREELNTARENVKVLYKVRQEMRLVLQKLLKDDGILVIPTVADPPLKLNSRKSLTAEFHDRLFALLSIASMSGGCQVAIPLGSHGESPISVSFIASHGTDKFLLDTVLDVYSSLQEEANVTCTTQPSTDTNGDIDAAELLKERGNAAFKKQQFNKALNYYTEAIKMNESNATYYSNRAAAYLELGCFQQAQEDCSNAIALDKKNVKAYLRRGKAREMLLFYREALQDFVHARVLEPQNKAAGLAEKRLTKLISK